MVGADSYIVGLFSGQLGKGSRSGLVTLNGSSLCRLKGFRGRILNLITCYLSGLLCNSNLNTLFTGGKFANGSLNWVDGEVEGLSTAVITLEGNSYLVFANILSAGTVGYGIICTLLKSSTLGILNRNCRGITLPL